jgi:hypothetical protein
MTASPWRNEAVRFSIPGMPMSTIPALPRQRLISFAQDCSFGADQPRRRGLESSDPDRSLLGSIPHIRLEVDGIDRWAVTWRTSRLVHDLSSSLFVFKPDLLKDGGLFGLIENTLNPFSTSVSTNATQATSIAMATSAGTRNLIPNASN